jgi:glycerol-3-phosphate O-acyltransferase/dihydroxyacetone phosphate acyltransferase
MGFSRIKRLIASYKILIGLLSPRSSDLPMDALGSYTTPPPPPVNPYIKRQIAAESDSSSNSTQSTPPILPAKELPKPRLVSSRKLIRHLLEARAQATVALCEYLDEVEGGKGINGGGGAEKIRYLREKGGLIEPF